MPEPPTDIDWVALAKAQYQDDGTLEIDEGAAVSRYVRPSSRLTTPTEITKEPTHG
jgi:hypothetical protein